MVIGLVPGTVFAADSYVAYIGAQGYESLAAAIEVAQSGDTITLADGEHIMPGINTAKVLTIQGGRDAVIELANPQYEGGVGTANSVLTFNGVTVKFNEMGYRGFKHTAKVTYTDCAIEGTQFLYAPEVTFTNCIFNVTGDAYAVWTYAAASVTFTGCTFNTGGKAILVYTEGAHTAEINVSGCTFKATTNRGKAAVEVGQSANGAKAGYTLNISGSTADTNFVANKSTSNLWGNKNDMDGEGLVVEINNALVYPVYPAKIGETGYNSLAEAIAAAVDGDTITLADGTHPLTNGDIEGKSITITGGIGVVVEMYEMIYTRRSTIAFEGITADFGYTQWNGLAEATMLTYTNCVLKGTQWLYAAEVVFEDCTFIAEGDNYNIWTWGANNVTFIDCIFNTDGKAVLVYGGGPTDVTLSGCQFNATTNRGKAAVETVNDYNATYSIKINNCTADTNFVANKSTSNLWGNKNNMSGDNLRVEIDNKQVYPVLVAQVGENKYNTLQEAIDAANTGDTIVILSDFDENGVVVAADDDLVIDLNDKTVDVDIMNYGKLTVKNGTINNTNSSASAIENNGSEAELTVETLQITSERHALRIDGGKTTVVSGSYATVGQATVYAVNISTGATVEILDGIFKGARDTGTNEATAALKIRENSTVTIANGNFSGGVLGTLQCDDTSTISITGGTYDEDPTEYLAAGLAAVKTGNVYVVIETSAIELAVPTDYLETGDTFDVVVKNAGGDLYGVKFTLGYDDDLFELTSTSKSLTFDNSATGTMEAIAKGDVIETYTFKYLGKSGAYAPSTADFTLTNIAVTNTPVNYGETDLDDVKATVNLMGKFDDSYVTAVTGAVYNGNKQTSATVGTLPEGASVTYNNEYEIPSYTNAGDYTVNYTITCENYETYTGSYTFKIVALAVSITPNDLNKTFGEVDPHLTGNVTTGGAELSAELLAELGTITYTRESGEAVGTYKIAASYADNSNFAVTANEGTFTIIGANLTVIAIEDYAYGKTLYLVCTNDNAAVKYNGYQLYEMSDIKSKDAYSEVKDYAHVYGWVALNNEVLTTENVTVVAYKNVETIVHNGDVDGNGKVAFGDRVSVGAIYNGNKNYFAPAVMYQLLGADTNMDGKVDAMDAPTLTSTASN